MAVPILHGHAYRSIGCPYICDLYIHTYIEKVEIKKVLSIYYEGKMLHMERSHDCAFYESHEVFKFSN